MKDTHLIVQCSRRQIGILSTRELFIYGIALYWSEGAKQKFSNISQRVCFTNSDPQMMQIFLLWLDRICYVSPEKLEFELCIHENANIKTAVNYWKKKLITRKLFIRLTKHKIKTGRNVNFHYKELVRVTVRKSTDLNRKISGWIQGIAENWGVV